MQGKKEEKRRNEDQNEIERVNKSEKCKARNETFLYCAVVAH